MHAAQRRLQEEMGFTTSLIKVSSFLYKNSFDNQLIEHELDHVFIGLYNPDPIPHDDEVVAWKYMSLEEIKHDITFHEDDFTYWFKLILQDTSLIEQHLNNLLS
jgi:isopentenyl-diphosphate delta-isomerase